MKAGAPDGPAAAGAAVCPAAATAHSPAKSPRDAGAAEEPAPRGEGRLDGGGAARAHAAAYCASRAATFSRRFFFGGISLSTHGPTGDPRINSYKPPPRHPHRRASPARPSHPTYPRAAAPHALGSAPTVPVGRQATHHLSARRGTIFRAVRVGMTPAVAGHRAHTSPHRYNMHVLRPVRTIQRCMARGAASEGRAQPAKGCAVAR